MEETKPTSISGQLSNPVGSSKRSKQADKTLRHLLDLYNNRHPGQQIDIGLTALIFVICQLYDSVRKDPQFHGGYSEAARIIRRHLFNHLNLGILYKSSPVEEDPQEE